MTRVICHICSKIIRKNCRAVECDSCLQWCHFKCSKLLLKQFNHLSLTNDLWLCQPCYSEVFPFHNLNNNDLLDLVFNSNTLCHCSPFIDRVRLENLPHLDIVSSLNSPNLSDFDLDINIPSQINSKYYSPHEFHSSYELSNLSDKSLSLLHCNIRSISKNFDKLQDMLSTLNHPFKLIALSETWHSDCREHIANCSLPGFTYISKPTKFSVGGVGLFIADSFNFILREDLSISNDQQESLWVEIQNNKGSKNILCGVIYRHPNSSLDPFLEHFYKTMDKISKEGKLCLFSGDINLNLLNSDSHQQTGSFHTFKNCIF
ncbi:uncharacterized protein LOC125568354 [Nematostella vectensis]|uniref:uncharacterized protein LOC125568354 n=1 Tax=Nematostella vectensis TaxID=45351 RepID=UPI0020776156|nr:uncharacterized protein LOC125568354 [Nematostella vectensis]